jgi:hypothetical protein
MSVLACERVGCENIMCDHMIRGYYLCNDCIDEFKMLVGDEKMTEYEFNNKFSDFMSGYLFTERDRKISVDEFIGDTE